MRVLAAIVAVQLAGAAKHKTKMPTSWPAPHNTSKECVYMLSKHKLDWLLEPFTCTKKMTSSKDLILGTGLGAPYR